MAKPNFKFQKRQKELENKKKNEEKMKRKQDRNSGVITLENAEQSADADEIL